MSDEAEQKKVAKVLDVSYRTRIVCTKTPTTFDNTCKEVILRNKVFSRQWPKKYEFLTGEFFKKVLKEECKKAGLPVNTFERELPKDPTISSPIPIKPSPILPKTSSAMVGFRSSHPEYNLEFTGRMYVSPKWTVDPPLEPGELRSPQRFIFLG